MNKEASIRDRVEQIVNIDTNALLYKIHSLERQLSNFNRVNSIPTWANSIIQRIELLEQRPLMNTNNQIFQQTINTNNDKENLVNTDIKLDIDINRIKAAIHTQINTSTLVQDVKIDLLTCELDRMHNLLALRPTTSELQQVVLSLNDTQRKVFDSLDEMAAKIRYVKI